MQSTGYQYTLGGLVKYQLACCSLSSYLQARIGPVSGPQAPLEQPPPSPSARKGPSHQPSHEPQGCEVVVAQVVYPPTPARRYQPHQPHQQMTVVDIFRHLLQPKPAAVGLEAYASRLGGTRGCTYGMAFRRVNEGGSSRRGREERLRWPASSAISRVRLCIIYVRTTRPHDGEQQILYEGTNERSISTVAFVFICKRRHLRYVYVQAQFLTCMQLLQVASQGFEHQNRPVEPRDPTAC